MNKVRRVLLIGSINWASTLPMHVDSPNSAWTLPSMQTHAPRLHVALMECTGSIKRNLAF